MTDDKRPRWDDDPPPGFKPDGTSMIVPAGQPIQWPEITVQGPNGEIYTAEEYEALLAEADAIEDDDESIEDDDDYSDLDEIDRLIDEGKI